MLSSSLPAWPTNGSPRASSSAPGASPTNSHGARRRRRPARAVARAAQAARRAGPDVGGELVPPERRRWPGAGIAAAGAPATVRLGGERGAPAHVRASAVAGAPPCPVARIARHRRWRRRPRAGTGKRGVGRRRQTGARPSSRRISSRVAISRPPRRPAGGSVRRMTSASSRMPRARRRVVRVASRRRHRIRRRGRARSPRALATRTSRNICSAPRAPASSHEALQQRAAEPPPARIGHDREVEQLRLAGAQHHHAERDDAALALADLAP